MSAQKLLYYPLQDFLLIFVTAAACGDLCRSVGRNRMVGFLPRQLTCHHTQQMIRGKFTQQAAFSDETCELSRQETDHLDTTHASTQVATGSR